MRDTEREREAETQAEGEAGSVPGARCGTRSQVSRIAPWAKGRRQTAKPPRDPQTSLLLTLIKSGAPMGPFYGLLLLLFSFVSSCLFLCLVSFNCV